MAYDLDFDVFAEAISKNRCPSDGNPLSTEGRDGLKHCTICSFATDGAVVTHDIDLQGAA